MLPEIASSPEHLIPGSKLLARFHSFFILDNDRVFVYLLSLLSFLRLHFLSFCRKSFPDEPSTIFTLPLPSPRLLPDRLLQHHLSPLSLFYSIALISFPYFILPYPFIIFYLPPSALLPRPRQTPASPAREAVYPSVSGADGSVAAHHSSKGHQSTPRLQREEEGGQGGGGREEDRGEGGRKMGGGESKEGDRRKGEEKGERGSREEQ